MANMLFANNCNTTLNGGITAVATSMVVTSATGFPVPTGSQYFYCTLADAATQTTIEIVKVTAVSGTTFTIVRGQDGTTGTIFASGAVVSLRLVRASLNDFPKLDEDNTFTGILTANSFIPSSSTIPTNGLYLPAANALGIATNSTNALYIDSSQNLLLGATATSRGGKIFIKATSQNLSNNFANLQIQSNDALAANVGGSIGMGGVYDGSGNTLSGVFLTGRKENATANSYSYYLGIWTTDGGATCAERARFDSTGYFLLGTTSATATPTNGVQLANASGTVGSVYIGHATGVAAGNYYTTFSYNGGMIGSITQAGTTAVTFNTSPTSSLTSVDANTLAFRTNSTEQMRIFSSGGVSIGNTTDPGAGNLRFNTTNSNGIYFGSSTLLSDYEEGTWTPTLVAATGTITSQTTSGTYVKIGKMVICQFKAAITGGTITAISSLNGFPYTSNNSSPTSVGVCREYNATGLLWDVLGGQNSTSFALVAYNNSNAAINTYAWAGSITYYTV